MQYALDNPLIIQCIASHLPNRDYYAFSLCCKQFDILPSADILARISARSPFAIIKLIRECKFTQLEYLVKCGLTFSQFDAAYAIYKKIPGYKRLVRAELSCSINYDIILKSNVMIFVGVEATYAFVIVEETRIVSDSKLRVVMSAIPDGNYYSYDIIILADTLAFMLNQSTINDPLLNYMRVNGTTQTVVELFKSVDAYITMSAYDLSKIINIKIARTN